MVANNLYLANPIDSSLLRELDKIVLATAALIFAFFFFAAVNFIFQSLMNRFFTTVNAIGKLPIKYGVTRNI